MGNAIKAVVANRRVSYNDFPALAVPVGNNYRVIAYTSRNTSDLSKPDIPNPYDAFYFTKYISSTEVIMYLVLGVAPDNVSTYPLLTSYYTSGGSGNSSMTGSQVVYISGNRYILFRTPFNAALADYLEPYPYDMTLSDAIIDGYNNLHTNIYYHFTNCSVSPTPNVITPGSDVVIAVVPDLGYTVNSGDVVIEDSVGSVIPFILSGTSIAFVYPQPIGEQFYVSVTINCSLVNPYAPGGESVVGGGGGDFQNPQDIIPRPDLPSLGIADGTFMAMFNPTQSQLKDLADVLFDTSIWTETVRRLFGNPIDYIVSLGIVPIDVPVSSQPVQFSLGVSPFPDLYMYQITQQYVSLSCGQIVIPEYWKAFLDYEPYSSIQIFLPYIGYRELNPSEVLNKALSVTYHVDLLTGVCIAFVEVDNSVLYQFDGNCLTQLPLSSVQHSQIMSGLLSTLGLGVTALATKGLGMFPGFGDYMLWGAGSSAVSSVVNSAKPSIVHGGTLSTNQGYLGVKKPYCILRRPRQAIANEQNVFSGYASWYRSPNFLFTQGFTKVAEIHLENIPATEWEIREIERLLKEGVIF